NQLCDLRSNACCKISNKDKSQDVNVVVPILDTRGNVLGSNNSFITAGKSSIPESLIKFGGVPGFSPGLIHVLPVEINNAGEFGSAHLGESTQKPIRDISGSTSNNLFGSTPDYSNYQFEDVRFASSIQGPAYLPPKGGPTPPSSGIPDLEVPVSTYVPSFPTQKPATFSPPKPFVPIYSPSINNEYITPKPKQPFIPEYLPPSTPRPYVPPSTQRPTPPPYRPQPSTYSPFPSKKPYTPSYIPPNPSIPPLKPQPSQPFPTQKPYSPSYIPPSPSRPQQPFPTQKPYTPSYISQKPSRPPLQPQPSQPFPSQKPYTPSYSPPSFKPTTSREYLPPVIPTSSSNINNQYRPFPSTKRPNPPQQTLRPRPPPTFIPTTSGEYLPPRTPSVITYRPSYQPSPSSYSPFTSQSYKPTPGYSYAPPATTSRPKPTVIYQTSPSIPQSSYSKVTPGYTYEKPTPAYTYPKPTPGYSYPKPTPSFEYPTTQKPRPPPTQQTLIPSSSYNIPSTYKPFTNSYNYPKPSPSPSIIYTQKIPTTPRPSPTSGYEYPKPTPEFNLPSQSATNISPSIRPFQTTQKPRQRPTPSYLPPTTPPRPTPGYTYPKPTPAFEYPDRDGASGNTNNQYIPPPRPIDKDGSDSSDTSVSVRPRPTLRPRPDNRPDQTITNENVVPPAACAAALKCVQEIYCSADGIVSPVPVVLTNEQALSKVPTTVCRDVASGTIGVCCRDPNYKDPWPSANLVNGFDDGQYKEDDSISQYKPSLNDIAQYRPELSRPSRSNRRNIEEKQTREYNDFCGSRDKNTSPKGPGPLNTNFAEIPWQAMILRDSNRSLLCGGAIIRRNAILTNAHCVEGIPTSDILVKGGEWKLGIDEEPLPFQIVKVSVIVRHPGYKAGSLVNDLAILILEEKLRPAKNIGTICLPEPNKIPTRNCVATGWGKRILQLHAKGAVMRSIKVDIMETDQCKDTLGNNYQEMMPNYSPNTLCGFSAQDQCKVDYGSALACTNDDSQYVLSGIFAWDTGCKDQNQIGGYVAPDVDWINDCLSKPVKVLKRLSNAQ
ncbi:hypothetical protein WA026_002803, partial [Henosepilachna vigintioctopunctata]